MEEVNAILSQQVDRGQPVLGNVVEWTQISILPTVLVQFLHFGNHYWFSFLYIYIII